MTERRRYYYGRPAGATGQPARVLVPALADQLVKPMWKLTAFHQFADPALTTVVSDGIALFIVSLIVCVSLFFLTRLGRAGRLPVVDEL